MSQITLYLDDATQALVDAAAQASGLSKSSWVAELMLETTATQSVLHLYCVCAAFTFWA